jgi:hypothetical protein
VAAADIVAAHVGVEVFGDGGVVLGWMVTWRAPSDPPTASSSGLHKVFSTGILKILPVTDKQEYQIFIDNRNKISRKNLDKT